MHKEQSDVDVALSDGADDGAYLRAMGEHWPRLLDEVKPDVVFYQCGVDILESDKLGRLSVSEEGCKERDRQILQRCHANDVPVVCTMGGGYSPDIWQIVEAHCNTFRIAAQLWG